MVRRGLLALVLLVVLAAGCGGGSKSNGEAQKSPEQVVADAQQAAVGASAVHVAGGITSGTTPVSLDLTIVKGSGGKGSISTGNLKFDVVRVGDSVYIKGSDAFLKQFAGAAAQLLRGKWLKGSATSGKLAALAPLTDIGGLFKQAVSSHGKLANKGETSYQGQKVVEIDDTTKGGTLYVAATGTPYPIALVGGGKNKGTVTFDNWNDKVTITAPKGAIDLSQFGA